MPSRGYGGNQAPSRSRTVCTHCIHEAVAQINGVSYCERHYEMAITVCGSEQRPHDWLLDSTEVLSTADGPVIRALYYCHLCGRGLIAKPGETADQAVVERERERLLRILRMLAE